jgi:hypothetical protein
MSEWDDWLAQQAAQGPARAPATLGEVVDADWGAAGLQTPFGVRAPREEAAAELNDAYRRATGVAAPDAAAAAGYAWPEGFPDAQAAIVHTLTAGLPDAEAREVAPYADVDKRAAEKAQAIEARAADVGARTYGLTGNALGWTTGFARTLVDPTSILGAAVGAPEAGLLKNWIVREAAVNAGFGAGVHVAVAPQREELGLPTDSLAADVAASAAGGVALGGLFRAAGWALGRVFDRNLGARPGSDSRETAPEGFAPAAAPPPPEARAAAQTVEPEDFGAAARFVEDRAFIEAEGGPNAADRLALGGGIDAAAEAADAGQPLGLIADARMLASSRLLMQRLEATRAPDVPFAGPEFGDQMKALNDRAAALQDGLDRLPAGDPAAVDRLARLQGVESSLARAETAAERRALSERRDQILVDTAPEALAAAAAPFEQRRVMAAELASIQARMTELGSPPWTPRPLSSYPLPEEIARPAAPLAETGEAGAAAPPAAPAAGAGAPKSGQEGTGAPAPARGPAGEGAAPAAPARQAAAAPAAPVARALSPETPDALAAARRGEAERVLAQAPDLEIQLPGDKEGEFAKLSARQALAEADEDARAAQELGACVAGDVGEMAEAET